VTSSNGKTLLFKKVLLTPLFHKNIVSIGVFVQKSDYEVSIKGQTLSLSKRNELENIEFKSEGKELLYYFEGTRDLGTTETVMTSTTITQPPVITPAKKIKIDINEAHDKFGQIGEVALQATLKMLNIEVTGSLTPCEGCAFAKAKAKAVPKFSTTRATHAGERLCTDISGPYKKSIIGSNYWVLLVVDDYSSKAWSFFVKKKSEMSKIIENLVIKLKSAN
jgi:hypothetical protein